MPYKEFLEEYPLYRRFKHRSMCSMANQLEKVRLNMPCPTCESHQTFAMVNEYWETCGYMNYPIADIVLRANYRCTHCQEFLRYFFFKVADDITWLMKVG